MARIRLELPERFPYTTELDVRVTDLNYGGHVGNDTVLSYVSEARARFFRDRGMSEMNVHGLGIILADAAVVYRAEAFFGERLRIHVAAQDFNRYGCNLLYRIDNAATQHEVARAKTGIVCFDYGKRRIARAPADLPELLG